MRLLEPTQTMEEGKIANYRPHHLHQSLNLNSEKNLIDPNSSWGKIRNALKEELGDSIDKTWFSQIIAEEHTTHKVLREKGPGDTKNIKWESKEEGDRAKAEKSLTLHLPNKLMRDMVKQRYGNKIEQYCKILTPLKFHSYETIITKAENLQLSG